MGQRGGNLRLTRIAQWSVPAPELIGAALELGFCIRLLEIRNRVVEFFGRRAIALSRGAFGGADLLRQPREIVRQLLSVIDEPFDGGSAIIAAPPRRAGRALRGGSRAHQGAQAIRLLVLLVL